MRNNTLLVGAFRHGKGVGSAYVFERNGTSWAQQATILPDDGAELNFLGSSVAINTDEALIAAPGDERDEGAIGSVYWFTRLSKSSWTQEKKLNFQAMTRTLYLEPVLRLMVIQLHSLVQFTAATIVTEAESFEDTLEPVRQPF